MIQLNVSGNYVTVVVNGSIQEEVSKTADAIEYNKYSDGKVSLKIGRRSFEMVDPTIFEIDGEAVTDAADFVTKLTAVFSSGGGSVTISATEYADNTTALAALGAGVLYKSTTYINGSPIILITI